LALSALAIVLSMALMLALARLLGIPGKLAALLGVGTAICGGSAILAAAPVIEAEEKDIAFSVASVAMMGLCMMFLLPPLAAPLGMGDAAFGAWAGLTVHQTPQAVAAGL